MTRKSCSVEGGRDFCRRIRGFSLRSPQGLALAAQPRQKDFCHYLFCKHFPFLKAFQGGKELVMCFLRCSWEGPWDIALIRDRKKG